eukprot:5462086-Prymnesium_polylepis.1
MSGRSARLSEGVASQTGGLTLRSGKSGARGPVRVRRHRQGPDPLRNLRRSPPPSTTSAPRLNPRHASLGRVGAQRGRHTATTY